MKLIEKLQEQEMSGQALVFKGDYWQVTTPQGLQLFILFKIGTCIHMFWQ